MTKKKHGGRYDAKEKIFNGCIDACFRFFRFAVGIDALLCGNNA
jgi:hypothetical protein